MIPIVASATQIAITASEDIAALTGVTLDGAATAAPTISGATATFNTGALATGTHTLSGNVRDAAGNPVTAHSLNPVPLLLAGRAARGRQLHDGILADGQNFYM